jgi:hypothetical protein
MIGEFLLIWLAVGFAVGIKVIYVDKSYTEEELQKALAEMRAKGKNVNPRSVEMAMNKHVVLAVNTLGGFYSLYSYIKGAIKKIKNRGGK